MPVVVTGAGVVSTLGSSVAEMTRRFAAGERARVRTVDGVAFCEIDEIPLDLLPAEKTTRLGRLDRFCRLLLSASCLAIDSAGLAIPMQDGERVGLSIGTGLGCLLTDEEYWRRLVERGPGGASPQLFAYTVSSAAAGEVSIVFGIKGANVTAHAGFAAGLEAIGYGFDLVRTGKADAVLAGGADALGPALVGALRDMNLAKPPEECEPFRSARAGLLPSEGAAVLVLEREDRAIGRGAAPWGRVAGWAAGFEPTLTRRDGVADGIAATVRRALAAAGRRPGDVGAVLTSAHGTPLDALEREGLARSFGVDGGPRLLAPKRALGETFGASGALHAALALGLLREPAAAPVVMVNGVCYSGTVVSLLVAET